VPRQRKRANPTWKVKGLDVETEYDPALQPGPWRYRILLDGEELWSGKGMATEGDATKHALDTIDNHIPDVEMLAEGHEPLSEPDHELHQYALWDEGSRVIEVDHDCVHEYREMDEADPDTGLWWQRLTTCPYPSPLSIRLRAGVGLDNLAHWGSEIIEWVEDDEVPRPPKKNPGKSGRAVDRSKVSAVFRRLMRL
jgi:hypothetical protein